MSVVVEVEPFVDPSKNSFFPVFSEGDEMVWWGKPRVDDTNNKKEKKTTIEWSVDG